MYSKKSYEHLQNFSKQETQQLTSCTEASLSKQQMSWEWDVIASQLDKHWLWCAADADCTQKNNRKKRKEKKKKRKKKRKKKK